MSGSSSKAAAEAKLNKVLDRIDELHEAEREKVFAAAMAAQSGLVCAHVAALKASREAGLQKLREYSRNTKKASAPAKAAEAGKAGKGKAAEGSADAKGKGAAKAVAPSKPKKGPCEGVTTVNKLIKCLESCCAKYDKERAKK